MFIEAPFWQYHKNLQWFANYINHLKRSSFSHRFSYLVMLQKSSMADLFPNICSVASMPLSQDLIIPRGSLKYEQWLLETV